MILTVYRMPVNYRHHLLLDGDGDCFFTCGCNEHGQLGTGDTINKEKITQVNLPVKFISISAGLDHSLGIAECDGSLWSWGSNEYGQSGQGEQVLMHAQPTQIPGTCSFVQISAGWKFSLALDSDDHVWSFGNALFGRLGLGRVVEDQFRPIRIETLCDIKSISAGAYYGIVLDHSGSSWSFGCNTVGQLGLGDIEDRWSPHKIEGVPPIIQVSCGYNHSLILDSHGSVFSFGCNYSGQLGHSGTTDNYIPEIIPNLIDIVQIFATGSSSIVKNGSQHYFVFGYNSCYLPEEGIILSLVEQENWRDKIIFPGAEHVAILGEEGYLSFLGKIADYGIEGKNETKMNFPKLPNAPRVKNARSFVIQ